MTSTPVVFSLFATLPAAIITTACMVCSAVKSSQNREDQRWARMLAASVLILPASAVCNVIVTGLSRLAPLKYDEYVYRLDGVFGQLSFALSRLIAPQMWLQNAFATVYNLLPCVLLAVYATYLWKRSVDESNAVIRAYALLFVLAVPLYMVMPVCGPYYAFPGFPFVIPANLTPHPLVLDAPPNRMPSLHVATALMAVYFLRHWRAGLTLSSVFLVLTAIATLESGEHYVLDLVAAIPFSAFVFVLAQNPSPRRSGNLAAMGELSANPSLQPFAD